MKKFLSRMTMLSLTLSLILASVFIVVNNRPFYNTQYQKNNTEKATGLSMDSLNQATDLLLDYLNNQRNDLDMTAKKHGLVKEVFDQREKAHMVDVKNLYAGAGAVMFFSAAFALGTFFVLKKTVPKAQFPGFLRYGYKVALVFTIFIAAATSVAFTFGFERFWTAFHHVFFTNDLWLLDPRISTMINMFPSKFFLAMCCKILIVFLLLFALVGVFINLPDKKIKK